MRVLFFIFVLFSGSQTALSGETDWQEVAQDANLRLISSDVSIDGKIMLAFELSMPRTTWTYWRVPGETGIPLQLDFEGSTGVQAYKIHWPFPTREVNSGYIDYVYRGDVVLPVEVSVEGEAPFIAVAATLGVCSDICVPVFADFTLQLGTDKRDRSSALRITQAMAQTPIAWDQGESPIESIAFDQPNQQVLIRLSSPEVDFSSMILATANASIVFGSPQKSQIEGVIAFQKLGMNGDEELANALYTVSFMSPNGPYQVKQLPVALSELGG